MRVVVEEIIILPNTSNFDTWLARTIFIFYTFISKTCHDHIYCLSAPIPRKCTCLFDTLSRCKFQTILTIFIQGLFLSSGNGWGGGGGVFISPLLLLFASIKDVTMRLGG